MRYAPAALLVLAACSDATVPPMAVARPHAAACASLSATGTWVLHVQGGAHATHIHVVEVAPGLSCGLVATVRPSRAWNDTAITDIVGRTGAGLTSGDSLLLSLPSTFDLAARIVGDSLRGRISHRVRGVNHYWPVIGWRLTASPVSAMSIASVDCVTPAVLVRLDDAPSADVRFVGEMIRRGLVGEIAVPTALIGHAGRLSWDQVRAYRDAGFGIAAHSRFHHAVTGKDMGFLSEVVGSFNALSAQGLATAVFVQPGVWRDSIYFDTNGKLENWRGSLGRTVTRAFEAYAVPMPLACHSSVGVPLGSGHRTISNGRSADRILYWWRDAQRPGRMTTFLVHTVTLSPPSSLDWFLDSLAVGVREHRIQLVANPVGLF